MIDFDKIKALYKFGRNISWEDIQQLVKSATSKSYAPSEYLIQEGALKKEIFFIRKGLVRIFAINDKGDEITTGLRWENQPLASPDVILFGQPSRFYFQALEPTETLSMDYDLLQTIIARNPKLEHNRKQILLTMLREAMGRVESFVLYSPEERYTRFVAANPEIVNRVPNKYIANILGITPVSLSRIRKRLATKKK